MELVKSRVGQYAHDYDNEGLPIPIMKSVDIASCCSSLVSTAIVDFYCGSNSVLYFNLWLHEPTDNRIRIECSGLRNLNLKNDRILAEILGQMDLPLDKFAGIIECIAPDIPPPQTRKRPQKARPAKPRAKKSGRRARGKKNRESK